MPAPSSEPGRRQMACENLFNKSDDLLENSSMPDSVPHHNEKYWDTFTMKMFSPGALKREPASLLRS